MTQTATTFRCAWGWGNFWGHVLVAQGAVEAALSYGTELWDTSAPALVVAEAGGRWSDVTGRPGLDNGSLLTSNAHLHDGLVQDLGHLCRESGVAALLEAARVPLSDAARAAGPDWLVTCLIYFVCSFCRGKRPDLAGRRTPYRHEVPDPQLDLLG